MFDHLLIRPDLLDRLDNADLRILTGDGETQLLGASGIPDRKLGSDHLPILFSLSL